jgi:hypothetical protein
MMIQETCGTPGGRPAGCGTRLAQLAVHHKGHSCEQLSHGFTQAQPVPVTAYGSWLGTTGVLTSLSSPSEGAVCFDWKTVNTSGTTGRDRERIGTSFRSF